MCIDERAKMNIVHLLFDLESLLTSRVAEQLSKNLRRLQSCTENGLPNR